MSEEAVRILPRRVDEDESTPPKPGAPIPKQKAPSVYVTGHCAVGNCYGTKNLTPDGKRLLPACNGRYEYRGTLILCTHSCHSEVREMLAMIEELNALTGGDNALSLPSQLREAATVTVRIDDTPLYDPFLSVPTLGGPRTFEPTPTGRAARGELEDKVRRAIIRVYGFESLTPETIAVLVNKEDPPSVGAVHAVLTRWEDKSFAILDRKPMRFVEFTELGKSHLMRQ